MQKYYVFISHLLFILAIWTLIIKFVIPFMYALHYGYAVTEFILWDFWWVIHLFLSYSLTRPRYYTFLVALITSIAEILIIGIKFSYFFSDPSWTMWKMNWFVNKIFVLACFVFLLGLLITEKVKNREKLYAK